MTKRRKKVIGVVVTLGLLLVLPVLSSSSYVLAQQISAADFFAKKTVTIIVTYNPGGGTDFAARILATWWADVTGGNMVVKNMPGGGGLLGANYVYSAKPDGLTIGLTERSSALVSSTLFGAPGVKFDISKFGWMGFLASDPYAFSVGVKASWESMADLQKVKGFKFAAEGPKTVPAIAGAFIAEVFGLKDARIVTGYGGSSEAALAVSRGEANGYAYNAGVIARSKGLVKPPFLILDHKRTDWYRDTPALPEIKDLTPENKPLFDIIAALGGGKSFFITPGVPRDRVQFMREAFNQIVAKKAFLRQMKLKWPVWVEPISGEADEAVIAKLTAVPKADVDRLNQLVDKYLK